ncbi:hypothetical protein QJS10_CPB15g00956 [Acorus calamus]|uniref:Uncharacterized protein n=1 Tax=Acorus calamus TaxID=4465 RepID=A0AAV9D7W3_ACOCL|nr:hypothetical protein QJS10_CPB15g00956 [Acorus calamus]
MKSKIPSSPLSPPPPSLPPSSDPTILSIATLIGEMENLCDMAEELVVEESVTRLEFPVCGSPRDLIVAVADGGGDDVDTPF